MPYLFLTGHTLNGTAGGSTQFTVSCHANGTFTAVSSSHHYAVPSAETGVLNEVVTCIVRRNDDFGPTSASSSLVDWLSLGWLCWYWCRVARIPLGTESVCSDHPSQEFSLGSCAH